MYKCVYYICLLIKKIIVCCLNVCLNYLKISYVIVVIFFDSCK